MIPGDLDGLTQPALALTAPELSGGDGDGLLTVDKILALKLDADWVVLSACNTGAGAGAGAEAASGLGSAFFYAGTRALLVTNWSVHSASARDLTSDLFRRQSGRSQSFAQRSLATIDDGIARWPRRRRRERSNKLHLCPSAVLGAVHGDRRRRWDLIEVLGVCEE